MIIQASTTKKLLLASLAAAALTLSACADKDSATSDDDPMLDAQTEVEQEATGVDDVEQVTDDVNSVDISDDPLVVDPMVAEDDMSIVTVDEIADADIMDGSAEQENISTY